MARISLGNTSPLTPWNNGNVMTAEDYKREREIIVTAINDNYDRVVEVAKAVEVPTVQDYSWTITGSVSNPVFTLPSGKSYATGQNVLRVVVEGFELANTDNLKQFEEIDSTSFRVNADLSADTDVYASWSQVRTIRTFSEDIIAFNVMGVF
jgi:hypothetical protein